MSTDTSCFPVPQLGGRAAVSALRRNGVGHVVTVPDWVQLSMHAQLAQGTDGIRLLNVCSENQCVTIGAGLALGGGRPMLVMQNQGLYNCINTLRAVCMDAHVPLVFMVGQFGREYANLGRDPRESRRTMVRILEPLLETLGLPFWRVDSEDDLARMDDAYATAHARRTAALLLVGTPMSWN